jgi:hypothetical protein
MGMACARGVCTAKPNIGADSITITVLILFIR